MNQNVFHKVVEYLDIDTRRKIGFAPRKIDASLYEHLLPRPAHVYHTFSRTLFSFEKTDWDTGHIVSSPISKHDFEDKTMFNLSCSEYLAHIYGNCGCYYLLVRRNPWMTKLKVKIVEKN
jgi:hypothetical protein